MSLSTPVSLHCSICIEVFDRDQRPPVVLPCGHTYICRLCSKKLSHCAICRISLFRTPALTEHRPRSSSHSTIPPRGGHPSPYSPARARGLSNYSPSRASPIRTPTKQYSQAVKEPLPIPKNLVLLSLMDLSFVKPSQDTEAEISNTDDEDEVIQSVSILRSSAGTYAVRAADGVNIFPTMMDALTDGDKENDKPASDAKSDTPSPLVHPTLDESNGGSQSGQKQPTSADPNKSTESVQPAVHVDWGRTLQVVKIEEGIATLARNQGFVRITELAKIGPATDEACILEAKLTAIEERKEQLLASIRELEAARNQNSSLLAKALLVPQETQFGQIPMPQNPQANESIGEQDDVSKSDFENPSLEVVPLTSSRAAEHPTTPLFPRIDAINMTRDVTVDNEMVSPSFGCTEVILPFLCAEDDFEETNAVSVSPAPQFSSGANARPDAVDFRTGLSGHMALGSAASSRHDRLPQQRSEVRMMGEHRGAGSIRRIVQRSSSDAGLGSTTNSTQAQQQQTPPCTWASYLRQTRSSETT